MKFSIIIPVYNIEEVWLRLCLESIRCQSFSVWEAICVDDGSTNGAGEILDEYAARDSRFIVVHQQNGGEGAARNAGLAIACGEWVAFCDGDDVLRMNSLLVLAQQIESVSDLDFLYFDYDEITGVDRVKSFLLNDVTINAQCLVIGNDLHRICCNLTMWRIVVRREVLDGLQFTNLKIGEDLLYTQEALINAKKIAYFPEKLYGYVMRPSSTVHSSHNFSFVKDLIQFEIQFTKFYDRHRERFVPRMLHRRIIRILLEIPTWYMVKFSGLRRTEVEILWWKAVCEVSSCHYSKLLWPLVHLNCLFGRGAALRRMCLACDRCMFRTMIGIVNMRIMLKKVFK